MNKKVQARLETRGKLLDAAMDLMRQKGFAATSLDEVCEAAGVTKGSLFHHFKGKEDLGTAAAQHFADMAAGYFAGAPYRSLEDPVERLLGYVDFRIEILHGPVAGFSCLLGTFVQELYETHPDIRAACDGHISGHAGELKKDIELAKAKYRPDAAWDPEGLAFHMQAVVQGSLILAKAKQGPDVAVECLRHLRRYVELLFKG